MITVVSKRWSGTQPGKDDIVIDISRTNPLLGNPFPMRDKSLQERERVIAENNARVDKDLATQGPIFKEFNRIAEIAIKTGQNIALSCWCAPYACHGDRYKKEIDRVIAENLSNSIEEKLTFKQLPVGAYFVDEFDVNETWQKIDGTHAKLMEGREFGPNIGKDGEIFEIGPDWKILETVEESAALKTKKIAHTKMSP